jgi:hypothetical protein
MRACPPALACCLLIGASVAAAAPTLVQTIDLAAWPGIPATSLLQPPPTPLFPGLSLTSIAYDPVLNLIYVADSNSANVYHVDALTNTVLAAVNTQGLGTPPDQLYTVFTHRTVLVNPAVGRWAVTGPLGGGEFDRTTWLLGDNVPYGTMASGAGWDPVTNNIYQGGTKFYATQNLKYVYAGYPCAGTTNATAFNVMTSRVYVSCGFSDFNAGVYVFDGMALSQANANIPTPAIGSAVLGRPMSAALGLAVNPNTNRVYAVGLTAPGVLDVLDASTYQLITSIPGIPDQTGSVQITSYFNGQALPQPIAINTLTNTIFVLNTMSSTISIIDGNSNTITGTIAVPVPTDAVVQTNAETRIGNTIYDATLGLTRTLGGAAAMTVNEGANLLYVASVTGTVGVYALDPAPTAPAFSVNGTIADIAGVIQPGVTVTATGATGSATAVTDARGLFVLTGLTSDTYTIVPSEPGFSFAPQTIAVAGANVAGLKFTAFPPVVPASYTLSPVTLLGPGVVTTGTITLNQPAPASGQVVTLATSDPRAAKVPATVTVPAGQTTVSFAVQASGVSVTTPVTLTASSNGGTTSAVVTVAPGDSLKIVTATWSKASQTLTITATGSNAAATIQVQNANNGTIMGTLTNVGNGSFTYQQVIATGVPSAVNLISNLGGKTGKGIAIVP